MFATYMLPVPDVCQYWYDPFKKTLVLPRDAPIIGIGPDYRPIIGRFADNRNRPITMLVSADCYLLCIMMALDTEIIFLI